ncbi:uncharacterized protein [Clytia hemisphaerica]|uniref:Uncharacterized protein n=1 Tax=Clytia hemisphaerica TaxID=252671 RepID=A0A7M5X8C3_9CNID
MTSEQNEFVMIDSIPFYFTQPKEILHKLQAEFTELLKGVLGDDLLAIHPVGSGAIPDMPGTPVIDLAMFMKNFPPTEEQKTKLKEVGIEVLFDPAPHSDQDVFFMSTNKECGIHFLKYDNEWVKGALAFVQYLTQNEAPFNKYRQTKLQGAAMQ